MKMKAGDSLRGPQQCGPNNLYLITTEMSWSSDSNFSFLRKALPLLAALVVSVTLTACSGDSDSVYAGSPPPDYGQLADGPAPLAGIYEQANQLLPGGTEAFDSRMTELEGYPAVVNVWASWCGPCRIEFPHFQDASAEMGTEIAFLGVNSQDSESAAATFLESSPVPYPSFYDPDEEITESLGAGQGLPATAFFNAAGERTFTKLGPYEDEAALVADIERYASETG